MKKWDQSSLGPIDVSLRSDKNELASGREIGVFGDPIGAVVSLAQSLQIRGVSLQAGDMVATGSCSGLTQVVSGQRVEAVFDGYEGVQANFL